MTEAKPVERLPGRPEEMAPLTMRMATAKATAADRSRLRGPMYGIDFADRAMSLSCGPAHWTIFINKAIQRGPGTGPSVFDRPWIACVGAQALPEREALTTRFVLLTRPAGAQAHLDVVRSDGEIVYTGKARQDGAAISFMISDVERPGTAPLTISGRVTASAVTVETAVVFAAREGVRGTSAVVA